MSDRYEVMAKVTKQEGTCGAEHKVGDEFLIGSKTPGGMCLAAFYALFPMARVLQFGGASPWSRDPDKASVTCPDSKNPVIFELRRIKE